MQIYVIPPEICMLRQRSALLEVLRLLSDWSLHIELFLTTCSSKWGGVKLLSQVAQGMTQWFHMVHNASESCLLKPLMVTCRSWQQQMLAAVNFSMSMQEPKPVRGNIRHQAVQTQQLHQKYFAGVCRWKRICKWKCIQVPINYQIFCGQLLSYQ